MVTDIVKGTFKGFALLRQVTNAGVRPPGVQAPAPMAQPRPVYAPGYGLIPPSQVGSAHAHLKQLHHQGLNVHNHAPAPLRSMLRALLGPRQSTPSFLPLLAAVRRR